jgi:hypothetical protein
MLKKQTEIEFQNKDQAIANSKASFNILKG